MEVGKSDSDACKMDIKMESETGKGDSYAEMVWKQMESETGKGNSYAEMVSNHRRVVKVLRDSVEHEMIQLVRDSNRLCMHFRNNFDTSGIPSMPLSEAINWLNRFEGLKCRIKKDRWARKAGCEVVQEQLNLLKLKSLTIQKFLEFTTDSPTGNSKEGYDTELDLVLGYSKVGHTTDVDLVMGNSKEGHTMELDLTIGSSKEGHAKNCPNEVSVVQKKSCCSPRWIWQWGIQRKATQRRWIWRCRTQRKA